MNAIRRTAVLIGLTVAVIIGSSVTASATFADWAARNATVVTSGVAAPANVNVTVTYCHPVHTVDVTVSWPASTTTRGVTGYRVNAYLNDGSTVVVAQTDAATRSVSATVARSYLTLQPRVSVTTLTSYGWTTESARSAVISC
ncbi:hypothetical protein [Candidatus Blastococcus massiliensis]|uniref:hypothetical protein n=1 Tax=Candidatus Blastococcus massiliensis TaxID=1470358 RepID=UPI0004BB0389|nr:hypothetical protein [Candidatus Blastococcus massiliensis]